MGLKLSPQKRILNDGFIIYSFYEYQNIEFLLKTKYYLIGNKIYKFLSNKAVKYFRDNINGDFSKIYSIGIDDRVDSFYSHSGVIVREFSEIFKPLFGVLKATNNIHYAGKNLQYRKDNKKGFIYNWRNNIDVILIDDVITTGCSIIEARECLLNHNVRALFAITLSDARVNL
ncbi:ComF family protein [Helicobacter sp. MIT 14-3879]|uniref:ComF family protein n=1 Tax=Helicobacter sp. MIT 14-3879 TaxID=2040649 RepID=UPI000E1F5855|nr:ComF family protein [Helicobacter sp. MIT 14-3879]RDU62879.1 amidophosphoribosyltransferase [Helicobacter sp. MIT 14-3879]